MKHIFRILYITLLFFMVGCGTGKDVVSDEDTNGNPTEGEEVVKEVDEELPAIEKVSEVFLSGTYDEAYDSFQTYKNDIESEQQDILDHYLSAIGYLENRAKRDISEARELAISSLNSIEILNYKIEEAKDTNPTYYRLLTNKILPTKNSIDTKPRIGMTNKELILAYGFPNDINRTTTSKNVSEQWVYPNYVYVYLENDIVTTIQD